MMIPKGLRLDDEQMEILHNAEKVLSKQLDLTSEPMYRRAAMYLSNVIDYHVRGFKDPLPRPDDYSSLNYRDILLERYKDPRMTAQTVEMIRRAECGEEVADAVDK